jgi:hypothetical protein
LGHVNNSSINADSEEVLLKKVVEVISLSDINFIEFNGIKYIYRKNHSYKKSPTFVEL